jgi:hypothetical protein
MNAPTRTLAVALTLFALGTTIASADESSDRSGIDRTFHPDDRALTVQQATAAWNAEIDRVFETPTAGGG